jgi:hypothetical protein
MNSSRSLSNTSSTSMAVSQGETSTSHERLRHSVARVSSCSATLFGCSPWHSRGEPSSSASVAPMTTRSSRRRASPGSDRTVVSGRTVRVPLREAPRYLPSPPHSALRV